MVVCLCEFVVKAKVLERLKNTIYLSGNLLSVCVCKNTVLCCVEECC